MAPISFDLKRGAYQDNGASPWYSPICVGSQQTVMKLSLDTGTNMDWVTSTLCNTPACTQAGRVRFDPDASTSFLWVGKHDVDLDYGPWGSLKARIGKDKMSVPNGPGLGAIKMGLAKHYDGEKFEEMDWDGCLGLPAQGTMQHNMSFMIQDLVDSGALDPNECFFGQYTDPLKGTGECTLGRLDLSKADVGSMLILPFEEYKIVPYVWSTPLGKATFGGVEICRDKVFCLDTGSSRFKGDGHFMNHILKLVKHNPSAELEIEIGRSGKLVVPPGIYNQMIEKGKNAGRVLPQFHELAGVTDLFLAGSILLDHLYMFCTYSLEGGRLQPEAMVIFNRDGGPKIIQGGQSLSGNPDTAVDEIRTQIATAKGAAQ